MIENEEIKEYVRHLKILCPTTLEIQYFEFLLSSLEKEKEGADKAEKKFSSIHWYQQYAKTEKRVKELMDAVERLRDHKSDCLKIECLECIMFEEELYKVLFHVR